MKPMLFAMMSCTDGCAVRRVVVQACLGWALLMPTPGSAASEAERAKEIVEGKCFICHGTDGESSSPVFPRLAGQHASYVARQLADYKSGRRKSDTMRPMVEDLSPSDFAALGRYFESRQPIAHAADDAEFAQVGRFIFQRGNPYSGIPSCASCHGPDGKGKQDQGAPNLADEIWLYGGSKPAIVESIRTGRGGMMPAWAGRLDPVTLKSLAVYVHSLGGGK